MNELFNLQTEHTTCTLSVPLRNFFYVFFNIKLTNFFIKTSCSLQLFKLCRHIKFSIFFLLINFHFVMFFLASSHIDFYYLGNVSVVAHDARPILLKKQLHTFHSNLYGWYHIQ